LYPVRRAAICAAEPKPIKPIECLYSGLHLFEDTDHSGIGLPLAAQVCKPVLLRCASLNRTRLLITLPSQSLVMMGIRVTPRLCLKLNT